MFAKKAFNFDLDTKALKSVFGNARDGYKILKNEFLSNGFTHRQWSGYVPNNKMTDNDATVFVSALSRRHPWIVVCAKRFDVTDVGKMHSVLRTMKIALSIKSGSVSGAAVTGSGDVAASGSGATETKNTYFPAFLEQMQGMKPRTLPGAANQNASDNVNE